MTPDKFNALLKASEEEGRCHYLHPNGKFCRHTEIVHDATDVDGHSYVSLADLLREVAGSGCQSVELALERVLWAAWDVQNWSKTGLGKALDEAESVLAERRKEEKP